MNSKIATASGLTRVLRAAGYTVLTGRARDKFTAAWENAVESAVLCPSEVYMYPVTEHQVIVTVSNPRHPGNGVDVRVYGGRLALVEAANDAIHALLESRGYCAYWLSMGRNAVDTNHVDTVAEIARGDHDGCSNDPWTGEHVHNPRNAHCGHISNPESIPAGTTVGGYVRQGDRYVWHAVTVTQGVSLSDCGRFTALHGDAYSITLCTNTLRTVHPTYVR